jgi:phosphoglucosamine mutase
MLGKLFGSSGVRGIVNVVLTPLLACQVGQATATYVKAKKALVALDTRTSGQTIQNALVAGLLSAGTQVSLLGVLPTPAVAYLTKTLGADVGFMITASHNPPQYNGIKIFSSDSLSFTDECQNAVERIIEQKSYAPADWQDIKSVQNFDFSNLYLEMLQKSAKISKPWRIVVDPGCGAAFEVAPKALNAIGCKTTALSANADGYFSARSSEPSKESLQNLSKVVKVLGAEVGVAFDGDADRVAFIDEEGEFVDLDRVLAAYAGYVLKKCKGGTVVTNVEASMCFETVASKYGGKVVRTRVGDVYVSAAMAQHEAVFGGEPCGAWIHPQVHYCPDGPLSALKLLEALEEEKMSVSEFVSQAPEYITLRENLGCKNDQKQLLVKNLENTLLSSFSDHMELSTVDGVRLSLEKGWLLIRASGTEPLIRVTVEGESLIAAQNIMQRSIKLVKEQIEEAQK